MNNFRAELKPAEHSKKRDILPFSDFLNDLKTKVRRIFNNRENNDQISLNRGIPPFALREIMSGNPLTVSIPEEYGGRGGLVHENIAMLSMASYESLALSLTLGINSALFLQPLAKYARDKTKETVFQRFLTQKNMGGLMITEPGFGSDALNMQTYYTEANREFHIQGKKHWAGLTAVAD